MSAPGQPAVPEGWYADPTSGQTRWWTGSQWGAYAPVVAPPPPPGAPGPPGYQPGYPGQPGYGYGYGAPPPGRTDANTLAMLAQLGQIVGGFLLPLILYLTVGQNEPFVKHHAAESLNLSITYVAAIFAIFPLFFLGFVVPPLLILVVPVMFVVIFGHLGLAINATVKAYRGEWYRYPVLIRLVPGSVDPRVGR